MSTYSPKPLTEQAETLIARLNDGYTKIEEAERQGKDTAALNTFWIELLTDYMTILDEINTADPVTTQRMMFE